MLRAVQISFFMDPLARTPEQLLRDWPSLVDVAEAAHGAGVEVSVVQACRRTEAVTRAGVSYHFLPFGSGAAGLPRWDALRERLVALAPDVLHVHGLDFPRDVLELAQLAPRVPILLQDHKSAPAPLWRAGLSRRGFAAASGVAFCSLQQAEPFVERGLFAPHLKRYEIPECTCRFSPGDREAARRLTGVHGDPAVLWVGHLDANKDPLTVLDGVAQAARELPRLQLWCCFGSAPLMNRVKRRIAALPALEGNTHLLGRVPHEQVELLMRAADVFVLGSRWEGSGYSVIEALACGLPPVVTDIPSFRALTGQGEVGALWPCGDAARLRAALLSVAAVYPSLRTAARARFESALSFQAVGARLAAAYQDLQAGCAARELDGDRMARGQI
jgi:glycosyltransferase involved in cell wall biosynthesis